MTNWQDWEHEKDMAEFDHDVDVFLDLYEAKTGNAERLLSNLKAASHERSEVGSTSKKALPQEPQFVSDVRSDVPMFRLDKAIHCALCGGPHFAADVHPEVYGFLPDRTRPARYNLTYSAAGASDERSEEAVRVKNTQKISCALWLSDIVSRAACYNLPPGVGFGIFLAWYVGVLAAATILGGYWYGR